MIKIFVTTLILNSIQFSDVPRKALTGGFEKTASLFIEL